MKKKNGVAALVVPAHPQFYPHASRHAAVLRKRYSQVKVLSVYGPEAQFVAMDGVVHEAVQQTMPVGFLGFLRLMWSDLGCLMRSEAEFVEAIDPPSLVPAAIFCSISGARLAYFSMELYSELPSLQGRKTKRLLWRILERVSLLAHPRAQIATVCQSVAERISAQQGGRSVTVVRNVPLGVPPISAVEKERRAQNLRKELGIPAGAFLLAYQGKVESGRGLPLVIEFLRRRPSVHLLVWGHGPLESWLSDIASHSPQIHYLGALPFTEMMTVAAGVNAGLVYIEPLSESYRLSLPGKLFEYIQNRLPVLASPLPEITRVVKCYKVGEVAETFSENAFLVALDALVHGVAEQTYAVHLEIAAEELCWEKESNSLYEFQS